MTTYKAKLKSVIDESIQCNIFSAKGFTDKSYWLDLQSKINECVRSLSCGYIWHKEKFDLHLPILPINPNFDDLPQHLHSTVQFGDNIEDEWFIVYLVFEITKQFNDVIVQLFDNDGEFLLIEAADFLPKWINPNNTENRVYIYQNKIHIIPTNIINEKDVVQVKDAIHAIFNFPDKTKSADVVMNAIENRLKEYPQKIKDSIHRAVTVIPQHIAAVISLKPELISGLVDAYCNQDYLDKKICRNIEYKNTIETTVTFTKFLYAMLTHSKPVNNSRNTKKVDLGLKLTTGYQILNHKSSDIYSSKQWLKFLNNLKQIDYFNGNIEGSKDYLQLLDKAKEYFTQQECSSISNMANEIQQLLHTDEYKTQYELLNSNVCLIEDSDEWMKIHPSQLEELMKSRYGRQAKFEDKGMMTPHAISTQLTTFLKESSGFEGIENDHSDDRIDFDVNVFSDELKNILDLVLPDGQNSDSDENMSDYNDSDMEASPEEKKMDIELKQTLLKCENEIKETPNKVYMNLTQSIKEEGSASGPSSLLLKNIGINKIELLDSDDDDDASIK